MLSTNIVGKIAKVILLLLPLIFAGCNGGGSSSDAPTSSGSLVISNANSNADVVLGGTHQYFVSLVNAMNLSNPVVVTVTSSNEYVASIESNTCETAHLLSNDSSSQMCSFFIRGNHVGTANITVVSDNYPIITEALEVSQQWGTFSGEVYYDGITLSAHQLTFNGSTIYALTEGGIVVSSDGGPWQLIGGGKVITDDFSREAVMASDSTSVCIALNYNHSVIRGEVKCSTNGSNWQTSALLDGWNISEITVYNNTVYALVYGFGFDFTVMSCPVNNCSNWQQVGQIFSDQSNVGGGSALFESMPFIQNNISTYYESTDGSWQLYGNYATTVGNYMFANSNGVVMMPVNKPAPLHVQQVYYNSSSNIGGDFTPIGGGITVINSRGLSNNPLAFDNNSIFTEPGDGNIYMSTNSGNIWSSWNKVGYNNPSLNNVYVNDNKVYSISYYSKNKISGSQIYVYSLD